MRSVAKNFLAIQKELIKAESYTSRLSEHFVDIQREKSRTDSDQELHKSGAKGSSFTRKKGKSEGLCVEEEPPHLLMCLSKTLHEASTLCRKGAVGCFETGKQPANRGSVKRAGCTGASPKRHSLQVLTQHRENGSLTPSEENEHMFESVDPTLPVREPHPSEDVPHPSQDVPHPSQDVSFLINRSSVRSSGSSSDGDGNDHTHILEKLRSLEDERDRLLQEIDKQRKENLKTRQSLAHTWNNLENQNIQLAMALQDLSVATSEIKKASNLQTQLNELEQ